MIPVPANPLASYGAIPGPIPTDAASAIAFARDVCNTNRSLRRELDDRDRRIAILTAELAMCRRALETTDAHPTVTCDGR